MKEFKIKNFSWNNLLIAAIIVDIIACLFFFSCFFVETYDTLAKAFIWTGMLGAVILIVYAIPYVAWFVASCVRYACGRY